MQNQKSESHWNEHEVRRAAHILFSAEKNKSSLIRLFDEAIHWLTILLIFFGNCMINAFIVILSQFAKGAILYGIIIFIGVAFGWMVEMPLRHIERLDKHKHLLSRIVLPILALVNVYMLVGIMQVIEESLQIYPQINVIAIGLVYGTAFLLPHIFFSLKSK